MIVIGFSGKAGGGKDSAANALMDQMRADGLCVQRLSFAGKLKDGCAAMYGWDRDRLESDIYYKEGGLGGWCHRGKPIPIEGFDENHFRSHLTDEKFNEA